MLNLFCNRICDYFVKSQIIPESNKELYVYGLQQFLIMLLNIATTLLIGFIFGMIWQSLFYLLAYVPLRTYAGGYHAKTPVRCYFSSVLLIVLTLLIMKFVPWTFLSCWIGIALSGIFIFILAPVEDKNKPFTEKEAIYFKKKARMILLIEIFVGIIAFLFHFFMMDLCIFMCFATLTIMLVLGRIKNYILEQQ